MKDIIKDCIAVLCLFGSFYLLLVMAPAIGVGP